LSNKDSFENGTPMSWWVAKALAAMIATPMSTAVMKLGKHGERRLHAAE
jgi:hypothetical protein